MASYERESSPLSPVPSDFDGESPTEQQQVRGQGTIKLANEAVSPNLSQVDVDEYDSRDSPLGYPKTVQATKALASDAIQHSQSIEVEDVMDEAGRGNENGFPPRPKRSNRKRKSPVHYDEDASTPPSQSSIRNVQVSKNTPTPAKRKTQPIRGNWSPNYLLSNPKSKLATCNLFDILNNERAWTSLSREQQLHLLSILPGSSVPADFPEDIPVPNVLKQSLKSNLSFQADVRLFQEDLAAGRYEPQWLSDAKAAMTKRAAGRFDDWKESNREQFWGQKQKLDWSALAGESSQHNLTELIAGNCFQVGDMWRLKRGLRGEGKGATLTIEKEAIITAISADHLLTFSFPPGQHKFSSLANGTDIVMSGIDGPIALSNAILNEDGRIVGVRGGNSWKEFRCYRNNQDMGSLFDVRELYHSRNLNSPAKQKVKK